MRHFVRLIVALGLVVAGALAMRSPGTAAPPEPQPIDLPCVTGVSAQVLGNALPAAAEGQTLVMRRFFWEPGGGIGPHTHPGTLIVWIESGTFGFTLIEEGEMTIMRSGDPGTPVAEEPLTPGQEVELHPGDWFVERGMIHTARVIGDEPVETVFTGLIGADQPLTTCVEGTPTP